MSAATLLGHLTGVRQTGAGRWVAKCPSHEDRSPSLSIRELEDGRLLIYDFGGCDTEAVLAAVGLTFNDLFERPLPDLPPSSSVIPARDLLVLLDHELTVAAMILADVVGRRTVNEGQVSRLIQAAARIAKARDIANPAKVHAHAA